MEYGIELRLAGLMNCIYFTWGGIHEGPSRYWDYKANRPDSYGPLACSKDAVFMKAGQQGSQLTAQVYLDHDPVTDCACVHKGMCSFSTRCWSAFSLRGRQAALGGLFVRNSWRLCTAAGPQQLGSRGCEDGHVSFTLTDPTHFYCRLFTSVSAGVSDLRVWQTHVATNTYTHSLSLHHCVYAEGFVCVQVCQRERERESLVGMNSCRFEVYFVLFLIIGLQKSHLRSVCLVATVRVFSQSDFCGYCC